MKARRFDNARGFTLIELLAVITIIVLLAGGLVVSVGYFAKRAGKSRTRSILMMVEQGIEAFHDDYGVYPPEYKDSVNAVFFRDKSAADNPFNKGSWQPDYDFDVSNSDYDNFSSTILYYFLVERFDTSQPALDDLPRKTAYVEFPEYAVKDVDDDGNMEIVDAWGNPILYVAKDRYSGETVGNNIDPHEDKNENSFSLYSYGNDGLGLYESVGGMPAYLVQHKLYDDNHEMLDTGINDKYGDTSQTSIAKANRDNVINW